MPSHRHLREGSYARSNEKPVHAIHFTGKEMDVHEYNTYLRQALDTRTIDVKHRPRFISQ